tara:strand:+ start:108 stop:356 length:249 start_codon:yes stop_codon:yes gene_type:complete
MKEREQLEKLQVLLADVYKESIHEMRETGDYNAALLNGARQLLKDNNIISLSTADTPLGRLNAEILPFNDTAEDLEAMRQSK